MTDRMNLKSKKKEEEEQQQQVKKKLCYGSLFQKVDNLYSNCSLNEVVFQLFCIFFPLFFLDKYQQR